MNKIEEVKLKVSIPQYFYNIIVPQLGSYYGLYPVDFDSKPVVCCPLHDEDTPSMRFYPETNTFYCFGCRKGGDVVQLHREFTDRITGSRPTFGEAIDFLYDFFIKGNEAAQNVTKVEHLIKEEVLSTEVDLIRYCKYTNQLESLLAVDNDVKESAKRKIWDALDTTEILVDTNNIGALDAMSYIQNVVKASI